MVFVKWGAALILAASPALPATIGTVFAITGGATDIVLDEARARLYLVRTTPYNVVDVYSIPQRRVTNSIRVDTTPLTAAMSRDGKSLHVACYDGSSLNTINLDTLTVTGRVSLPAKPEGVAVGFDERVLITTIGTGPNNSQSTLLIFDPRATSTSALANVITTPPQPTPPNMSPPSGRIYLANRSQLAVSADASIIIGLNNPNATSRTVFVYDAAAGVVLRSRTVGSISDVLAVSPDGSKFMAGLTLFETSTLAVLAQQNAANAPFPMTTGVDTQSLNVVAQQFNLQQNQGGSVFSPDGSMLYAAFDIAPVQVPAARANITHFLVNDPDNLLIQAALQLPENLVGKLVITRDGGTVFALSESGFMTIPLATVQQSPLAVPDSRVVLLAWDQCGVVSAQAAGQIAVRNQGRGRITVTPQLLSSVTANLAGIGAGGAGGGAPGGGAVIIIPGVPTPVTTPGTAGLTQQQSALVSSAPGARAQSTPDGAVVTFTISATATRSTGTLAPSHDFLIEAPEAVNIPPSVRVYQNNRNAEASGQIVPVPVNINPNEGLTDIVSDGARRRLYIANSGMNQVEVFDTQTRKFLNPIKVGQLPRSVALSPDGNYLYIANTGSEYVGVVDIEKGVMTEKLRMPPIPFNAGVGIITPNALAASQRGLLVIMSNGQPWKAVGPDLVPRSASVLLGSATLPAPRSLVSTPNGEYILVLDGNGFASLYDPLVDDFVQRRQVATTPIQGFYGPVGAGPRGQYYLVNGMVLNQSLSQVVSAETVSVPGQRAGTSAQVVVRPIAAVAPVGTSTFVRLVQPIVATTTSVVGDMPVVELVDANTGQVQRTLQTLEAPLTTVVANARANIIARGLAVDPTGGVAYALTESGLSIISLEAPSAADRPVVNNNGTVSIASYTTNMAPGGLVSIFGRNMAASATAGSAPLPRFLGGVCATLNNVPMPLLMTSPGQINAQIPSELAAGRYPLIVRAVDRKLASTSQTITVSKYAPAVFVDPVSKQAAIFHQDGRPVTKDNPAKRDQRLVLYATGLGVTKPRVTSGEVSPSKTLAVTDPVEVFFGDVRWSQAGIVVEWSGLTPGFIGLYQINLYVPGDHIRGDAVPITIRIGNISTPSNSPVMPVVAVD